MTELDTLVGFISAKAEQDRAKKAQNQQLIISEILYKLAKLDADLPVYLDPEKGIIPGEFSCYRGYYSDLAIIQEMGEAPTREGFEERLNAVIGQSFEGYKGGTYTMRPVTLVWVANGYWDCSHMAVFDVQATNDYITLCTRCVED